MYNQEADSKIWDVFQEKIEHLEEYAIISQDTEENIFDTLEKVKEDYVALRNWVIGFVDAINIKKR